MHYLKQLPVQLLISILSAFALGSILDAFTISVFYTLSSALIEILLFVLPVIVFGFIFRALVDRQRNSLFLLLLIFGGVTLSNFIAVMIAYAFGLTFLPLIGLNHSHDFAAMTTSDITSLFKLGLPSLIGTGMALIIGISSGLFISYFRDDHPIKQMAQKFGAVLNKWITLFLQKVFVPLLPIYVFGFCLKLSYDDALIHLFQQFGKSFILCMALVSLYIIALYLIGACGDPKKARGQFVNMLPAGLLGFSTMSSAVAMPVTLSCTIKNTKDEEFSDLIIPSTANIHMLADNLTIVVMGMTLLAVFGMPWPTLIAFIPFALAFSLAKLSCVGAPGASILVVLPVLQEWLGFTPEMLSVITTIYILQDSFGTAANVMLNGAFALVIQRIYGYSVERQVLGDH